MHLMQCGAALLKPVMRCTVGFVNMCVSTLKGGVRQCGHIVSVVSRASVKRAAVCLIHGILHPERSQNDCPDCGCKASLGVVITGQVLIHIWYMKVLEGVDTQSQCW